MLLLVFLALLCTNVYVLWVGKEYNERVCRESSALAARAALEGKSTESVQKAARSGMNSCGIGGAFIKHPQFTQFRDEVISDVRILRLQTQTLVSVPSPYLLVGLKSSTMNNNVVFTSTYTYQIKNPKKAQSAED